MNKGKLYDIEKLTVRMDPNRVVLGNSLRIEILNEYIDAEAYWWTHCDSSDEIWNQNHQKLKNFDEFLRLFLTTKKIAIEK